MLVSFAMPPPWVVLWGIMAFAKTFAAVKDIVFLAVEVIFGGEGAACTLCDKIVTILLVSGDVEAEGTRVLDCENVCFHLDRCVIICDKIKTALQTSVHFPCVAAGYCPAVDEFGQMPKCKYQFPASCSPTNMCHFKNMRCQLSDGYKRWRRMNAMLTENLGAVAGALTKMPKCGEPGAHKTFCINEPTGIGMYCKQSSYLICIYACVMSVRAIESPGGDDDRQWLSFWIIFLIFTVFEAMTDVLLSWVPSYFEIKFGFLCWLVFCNGADVLYRKVHSLFHYIFLLLVKLGICEKVEEEEWDEEDYLNELPDGLANDIREMGGVQSAFSTLTSRKQVIEQFDERASPQRASSRQAAVSRGEQLLRSWERTQPRWLVVTLVKAEKLASLDHNGFSDPYCILALVSPEEQDLLGLTKGSSFDSLMHLGRGSVRSISNIIRAAPRDCTGGGVGAGRKDEDGFESKQMESKQMEAPRTEYKGACDVVVRPVVVDGVPCSAATDSSQASQAATCDLIVPQSVVKARKRWARVENEMVDAKVMTRVMNELKEELESDGGNLEMFARSHSHGSLSPCQTKAAAGLAGFFVKSLTTSVRQVMQNGSPFWITLRNDPGQDRGHFGKAFSVTGPVGPKNQYAKVQSKCMKRTLNPVYNQLFEMHLEGGEIDKNGNYHNQCAPFTKFRLEMWDRDLLSSHDFMGEITVPLAPLMSCRTMEGWFELTDPEGAYKNDDDKPLSGRVYLKFKWNHEALLEGSMRPQTDKANDQSKVVSSCNDEVDLKLDVHKWHMKKSPLSCASSHMPTKNGLVHLKASQSETAPARDSIIYKAASDSRSSQAPIHPYEAGQSETTSARDNVCPQDAELAGLKRRLVSKETELQKALRMCSETEIELEALRKELVAKKEFDVLLSANKKEDQHTNAAANKENEGKDKGTAPSHKGKATEVHTAEDMRARSEALKVLHLLPPHPAPPLQASVEDKVVAGKKCASDTLRSDVGVN